MSGESDFLTVREAAKLLRVAPRTLGVWRRSGKGPAAVKLGYNLFVYRRTEIDRWLSCGR